MNTVITRSLVLLLFGVAALRAQVPQLINYQGRVAVGSANFNGAGQFKFALVNGDGTTTFWSNDGTSTAGSEPTAAVTLTVTKGLYPVLLGDATLPNMTIVPGTLFTNADVRLRVWFNDGANGFQLLTPDQRIAAVGYAMMAANVPDGAITGVKIAPGAAAANLNAAGQSGVAGGGVVLSPTENASLINAGYVRIGAMTTGDAWMMRAQENAPTARRYHTAVWTGSEMIVWGGYGGTYVNTGGRYNPAINSWTAVNSTGAPTARYDHTAVWTGSEMIVWGGEGTGVFNDGGRYNPGNNSWTAMTTTGAPAGRYGHTAVWTGREMIVWGGSGSALTFLNTGGRYDPAGNTWTAVTSTGAPTGRRLSTAVWTGGEMIVWGGAASGITSLDTGGRYNPAVNTWTDVTRTGAPIGRYGHTAVWTGSEMIIWGGPSTSGNVNEGGRYNPAGNNWTPVNSVGRPGIGKFHTAVWTGSEMIVWGGSSSNGYLNAGRYSPVANSWITITTTGAPAGREGHTTVWTGSEMIMWGGANGTNMNNYLNDTFGYTSSRVMHLYQRP